jgi:hypothetical protein
MGSATVEKIAINAVMAGCRPEYLPVVIAAVEAVCTDKFNIHGVLATTHFAGPVLIVNGPIRDRIGMNYRVNALGQGNRANATIGRALQLVVRNVGGGRPGEIDRAALGQPGKYTFCFAENERESPWEPLHVGRGFARDQSAVTLVAVSGTLEVTNMHVTTSEDILDTLAAALFLPGSLDADGRLVAGGRVTILLSPEWAAAFGSRGIGRRDVTTLLAERAVWPDALLPASLRRAKVAHATVRAARSGDDILLVVAGGVGIKQTVLAGWAGGSTPVTVRV